MSTLVDTLNRGARFPFTELLLLAVAIVWGSSYGLTKSALVFTSVLGFIAVRFSLTSLLLMPFVVRDFQHGHNRDWLVALPTGGVLAAIFFCEVYGVFHTGASNAAFLISLSVIFTTVAERLINRKAVGQGIVLLAFLSVIGVFLLTYQSERSWSLNRGDYFILGAALLRALMVTCTKQLTEGKQVTTVTLTALQSTTVAASALLVMALSGDSLTLPNSGAYWLITAYLVVFCTLFAFAVQNYAVRRTSPTRVSLLMGSEPLWGALFAIFWLEESLTWVQGVGAALILVCVVAASLRQER